jgi:hypothetical protein
MIAYFPGNILVHFDDFNLEPLNNLPELLVIEFVTAASHEPKIQFAKNRGRQEKRLAPSGNSVNRGGQLLADRAWVSMGFKLTFRNFASYSDAAS